MKKTVQEGQELFYIEENQIYSGHAVEVMDRRSASIRLAPAKACAYFLIR